MSKIIIGTRGSILALAQAEKVKEMILEKYMQLRENHNEKILELFGNDDNLEVELKIIVTKGDKDMRDFKKIKGFSQKDLFVKEIEKDMLENKIDLAVHSLKDMPQVTPKGLINAAFPIREDNRDVLVTKNGKTLETLEKGAVIGTGSTRRKKEILNLRNDLIIKPIRGNIHTRLKKLENGEYDAIVLAAAGLKRVGLSDKISQYFEEDDFMPAPGQGILCIQCRSDDGKILALLNEINNPEVKLMCEGEREFSRIFDGGCHTPIGCSSYISGDTITLKGMYYDGDRKVAKNISGNKADTVQLAQKLAEEIKKDLNSKRKKGRVYVAGAGCGDEKLITLKLKEILSQAECIVYDRLVNENILQYAKPDVELIYMGKENTEGGELQKEINETIVRKGNEGKTVLRLKGGDPFVFGRGGEEIEALIEENIDFEVIPGITSAIAVPAYAGIPVTHRGINTSFHVFTGHVKIDGNELDFQTIAKLEGTLVFLMGLTNLEKITQNLIRYGKSENTPVAVIKDGARTKQKTYVGTLNTIVETVRKNNVKSPVIIIIGEVVNLREKMKWFDKKTLFGKNILVTRNRDKQEEVSNKINEAGGQAINVPYIDIEYLDFEMPDLTQYDALLFNSINSVAGFMKKINDMRVLGNIKIGVVGEKTAEEIEKYRIIPDFFPQEYTVEKLAEESVNFTKKGDRILFIVSNISPVNTKKYTELYDREYEKLVVYNTNKVNVEKKRTEEYVNKSDVLMFLSSSTFESFAESLELKKISSEETAKEMAKESTKEALKEMPKGTAKEATEKTSKEMTEEMANLFKNKIIASIGPVTTKTIQKYGLDVKIEADKYTEKGLLEKIISFYKN